MVGSLKVALIVGTVLAFLNHYDSIISETVNATTIFQIIMTYAVPYSVATFGSAMQGRHMELTERRRTLDGTNSSDSRFPVGAEGKLS